MLLKLSYKIEMEGILLLKSLSNASIALIPKEDKDTTKKNKPRDQLPQGT